MKAITRVCAVAKETVGPLAGEIIKNITEILKAVSKNPRNPQFNHALFETLSCLIMYLAQPNSPIIGEFEKSLFPPFEAMLAMETCAEFGAYVFQILAQLLELRQDLSKVYQGLYRNLLFPVLYENHGNVPALVRLLQAYAQKGSQLMARDLTPVLGVFQKLLASKKLEQQGMALLCSLIEYIPLDDLENF